MKRMAITDLAGMHCQLHETRNKKQAIARWKGPECVSSSFISLSCSCYIQKPFRYPTNVDHANCYVSLFFLPTRYNALMKAKEKYSKMRLLERVNKSKVSFDSPPPKTQGPWCLEKRLETGSSIKQGCIDGFTSQGSQDWRDGHYDPP